MKARFDAVLFDLDGCLVDSAPDLAGALNRLRQARGMVALPYSSLRPLVGTGARGMVGVGFGLQPEDAGFPVLRDAFLAEYAQGLLNETRSFDGIETLLRELALAGLPWGVVTNKATRFAEPLLVGLGLAPRAAVLICGDTTPFAKPHPEPLLEAARRLGCSPQRVLYVGDDLRDAQAAQAAGMTFVAACWGYLGVGDPPQHWGADFLAERPDALLNWLELD
jgi:phosphoglycolate phosphatase